MTKPSAPGAGLPSRIDADALGFEPMDLRSRTMSGITILEVSGTVNSHEAGRLYDALVAAVDGGKTNLIVDLSRVDVITHAGTRGLVVAAKLAKTAGREMRVCAGAQSVRKFLEGLGFRHLLHCDQSLAASIAVLSARMGRTVALHQATGQDTPHRLPAESRATDRAVEPLRATG